MHQAQLLTYLKLTKKKVGLLINFNEVHLKTASDASKTDPCKVVNSPLLALPSIHTSVNPIPPSVKPINHL
ncbi:MAG TPA: GxxExxY protein [Flavobacteriales bacterium]|nr:GxxExxY protein [Flavobacteriales bacterium]HRJ37943.1 GxxExxY protein [Flavobacteriales bacterium]